MLQSGVKLEMNVCCYLQLVSCLIYAWPLLAHRPAYLGKHFATDDNEIGF